MSWPVREYVAIRNAKDMIRISVFKVQGCNYSAVMVPIARDDDNLMRMFRPHGICHEVGKTIEDAIIGCESWIKTNLWEDAIVIKVERNMK